MSGIVFLQPGARHTYAMPRFLYNHGMLTRLYTDVAFTDNTLIRLLLRAPMPAGVRSRVLRRIVLGIPDSLLRTGAFRQAPVIGDRVTRSISMADIASSDAAFTQYFVGGEEYRSKAPGKTLISDVFIVPDFYNTVQTEIDEYRDWGEPPVGAGVAEAHRVQTEKMIAQSDFLFCPSRAVIESVTRFDSSAAAKCRLVPYGASMHSVEGTPVAGRVLFCGTVGLRKGVQYLAEAAKLLLTRCPEIRFVLAGGITPEARAKLSAPNMEILGHLGTDALREELGKADMFVFPSLAEGSASALIEAMASGLPCVATKASGVDFTDGESGIVIPPRDPAAIADAIVTIYRDKALRERMSASARREANQFSLDAWETRFIAAVRETL